MSDKPGLWGGQGGQCPPPQEKKIVHQIGSQLSDLHKYKNVSIAGEESVVEGVELVHLSTPCPPTPPAAVRMAARAARRGWLTRIDVQEGVWKGRDIVSVLVRFDWPGPVPGAPRAVAQYFDGKATSAYAWHAPDPSVRLFLPRRVKFPELARFLRARGEPGWDQVPEKGARGSQTPQKSSEAVP